MKTLSMIAVLMALGTMFAPALSQAMSEAGDRKAQADRELVQYYKDYNKGYYDNLENEADRDDSAEYLASAEYKAAKSANEFLKKLREVGYE